MKKFIITAFILLLSISLFGCSSNEVQFSEVVNGDISKISSRHGGSGILYSITDKEKINDFINIMNSTTYEETESFAVAGASTIRLYDETGAEITSVQNVKDVFEIGESYYKAKTDISEKLSSFYSEFYSDENLVKE
jgi:hypothetical protein